MHDGDAGDWWTSDDGIEQADKLLMVVLQSRENFA